MNITAAPLRPLGQRFSATSVARNTPEPSKLSELVEVILRVPNTRQERLVTALHFGLTHYAPPWSLPDLASALTPSNQKNTSKALTTDQILSEINEALTRAGLPNEDGREPSLPLADKPRIQLQETIQKALPLLSLRQQALLALRYALLTEEWTLKSVGEVLDLSESRMSQVVSAVKPNIQTSLTKLYTQLA